MIQNEDIYRQKSTVSYCFVKEKGKVTTVMEEEEISDKN